MARYVATAVLCAGLCVMAPAASAAGGRAVFPNPTHNKAMSKGRARRLTRQALRSEYAIPRASVVTCRKPSFETAHCIFGGTTKNLVYRCGTARVRATAKHLIVRLQIFSEVKCEN